MVGLWTMGKACAMVSAMKCVNLAIHRPVPLGLIIHYMLINFFLKLHESKDVGYMSHFFKFEKHGIVNIVQGLTIVDM